MKTIDSIQSNQHNQVRKKTTYDEEDYECEEAIKLLEKRGRIKDGKIIVN